MSCLTEKERIALEDIFLSISIRESPFDRCRNRCAGYVPFFRARTQNLMSFIRSPKQLKRYATTRLFLRQKKEKLRQQLKFFRHR